MERKEYCKPCMFVEKFVPQEYCTACPLHNEWAATCQDHQSLIFFGYDAEGEPEDWSSDASRGGCGKTHVFVLPDGQPPTANCWILKNVNSSNGHSYSDWFSSMPRTGGVGYVIKPDMIEELKTREELVPAYYNNHVLDGGSWLVTADLLHIHPAS